MTATASQPTRTVTQTLHDGTTVEVAACDICEMRFEADEEIVCTEAEVSHVECVRGWWRRNFGAEGLS